MTHLDGKIVYLVSRRSVYLVARGIVYLVAHRIIFLIAHFDICLVTIVYLPSGQSKYVSDDNVFNLLPLMNHFSDRDILREPSTVPMSVVLTITYRK